MPKKPKPKRKPKFADIVRDWRESRNLSKVQAAQRLGIPYRTFQDWELGNRTPRGIARSLIIRKLSILVAVLTLGITTARAGDGNWWVQLPKYEKQFYVNGVHDGLASVFRALDESPGTQQPPLGPLLFGNASIEQWSDGLDVFYADFRNRSIFVADALVPVAMAINGRPPEQISARIQMLRQQAATAVYTK